jgi:hypothetical protein
MSTQNPGVAGFFNDLDASSIVSLKANQITTPIVGQAVTMDEMMMGGGVRIIYFIFDRSPSMQQAANLLIDGFNNIYVPAVKAGRDDDISALRIGGSSFSTDITQIWQKPDGNGGVISFHALEDLPSLGKGEYNPSNGCGTALHKAIIEGTPVALKYASEEKLRTGIQPEVEIIILADGDNNESPRDPSDVRTIIKGSKKELVRFSFLYFETYGGSANPQESAIDMGFEFENIQCFSMKPGETKKEYEHRFRQLMRVMSKISASKGNSALNSVPTTADDDDF